MTPQDPGNDHFQIGASPPPGPQDTDDVSGIPGGCSSSRNGVGYVGMGGAHAVVQRGHPARVASGQLRKVGVRDSPVSDDPSHVDVVEAEGVRPELVAAMGRDLPQHGQRIGGGGAVNGYRAVPRAAFSRSWGLEPTSVTASRQMDAHSSSPTLALLVEVLRRSSSRS